MNDLHYILHTAVELSGRWLGAAVAISTAMLAIALLVIRTQRLSATSRHRILSIAMLAPVAAALLAASDARNVLAMVLASPVSGVAAVGTLGATYVVTPAAPRVDWICAFFALWSVVAGILALRWFVRALVWSRAAHRASPVVEPSLLDRFAQLTKNFAAAPRFAVSAAATEPMVVGVVRPTVLLPVHHAAAMTDEEAEAVLTHELEHVRRRDNLTAALHEAVTALFWFDPLHWIARRRLLELRERACDEHVLEHGCEAESYVSALARTCHTAIESPAIACMSGFQIRERIESIMTYASNRSQFASERVVRFTALTAAVAVVVAFGAFAPQPSLAAAAGEAADVYKLLVQVGPVKEGKVFVGIVVKSPAGKISRAESTIDEGRPLEIRFAEGDRTFKVDVPFAAVGQTASLEVLERNAVIARATAKVEAAKKYELPPPPPGYFRVGENVTAPKVITRVQPKYTEEARAERLQGICILEAMIDEKGVVKQTRILKDLPKGLGQSAADAVSQWRFEPALMDGKPVPVAFTLTINFKLDEHEK